MGEGTAVEKCGLTQVLIFLAAIVSGTACSICSKTMMGLHGVGITGEVEVFTKPLFQTFGMFVGMLFGLVMHFLVLFFHIPFPGYEMNTTSTENHVEVEANEKDYLLGNTGRSKKTEPTQAPHPGKVPTWMYFFLIIPSIFDLGATALCMMGLRYLDVSIYQMLRGSGIIFVALMKQHVLKDRLYNFQWLGVAWNVVSVVLVGSVALLNSSNESSPANIPPEEALLGVLLVMAGAFVQALQFVFEEKVMTMDIPSPPLLLIGMEGLWGTVLCLFIMYPLAYYLPGDDHGSYEDAFNTWQMFLSSSTIQLSFVIYFFTIFAYNLFAVLVTFMLNSVWHAILDNFRPITVWTTDMYIYYVISMSFGEPWTQWSWIQVVGMFVLLYGTSVYNAPNAGSIQLVGKWYHGWFDFSQEYNEIMEKQQEEDLHTEWEERQKQFTERTNSSFYGERSPMISIHTQALRGLGTPHV
jgi:hypothetical protein